MKHNNFLSRLAHFFANGALTTPPCNSHKFNRFLSFCFLAVTLMVSANAWGWVLAGEGLPDMNTHGQGWDIFKPMSDMGSGIYGITFSNVEANSSIKYRVKVLSNNGAWDGALDKNKLDISRSNVEFVAGDETQIAFNTYAKMDICIYTDGSKVWVLQHYPGSGASSTTIALRGDMWLSDAGGWRENDLPTFTKSTDNKSAFLTVVLPVSQTRVALVKGGSTKNPGDGWEFKTGYKFYNNQTSWNYSSTSSEKVIFAPLTKTIAAMFTYSNQKVYVAYSDYIVKKQGWHVFIDGNDKGVTNADGELVISGLSYSDGGTAHTIYVTDGSTTNCWFGVNKFGGLYIDMSNSNVTWGTQYIYKTSTSQKFSDASWPIVGNYDQTGRFKLNENKAVKVTFDGGKMTINKATPAVTYPVHFNTNGGGAIADVYVAENTAVTKPADPTKQNKGFAGWYSDEQLQNKYDFSTPVTREMTLYAKWADPFTQGETIYFFLDDGAHGWTDAGANIRALFYDINDKNKCLNTNNYEYGDDQIGNLNLGVSHFGDGGSPTTNVERIGSSYWYKVIVPYNNAGAIRFVRLSSDPHYMWCYATNKYVGDRDGYPSIRLTTNSNRDSNAEWYNETPCWTVTFDMMGHGDAIAPKQVIKGEKVDKPTNPSADGWKFVNWYKENTFSNVYNFNDAVNNNMTLYAKWEQLEMVTVQFATDGGQPVPANQEIEKGTKATKPATDPAKAGYNFTGWDWNFNDAINADKTINAQYTLKGVESVTLDKATLKLVEKGATGTIAISTILPSDVLSTTTTWSSDNTGVATVNNGVVTPVAKGTATITCTVANATDSKSATCVVTVKGEDEDCEMVLTPIYNYIIGSTPTGGTGATDKLFDPSKQSEPEKITAVQIKVGNNGSYFAYVDPQDTDIKHGNVDTDYAWWIKLDAGTTTGGRPLYYLKNVATGKYLCMGEVGSSAFEWGWSHLITAEMTDDNRTKCQWYETESNGNRIVCYASAKNGGGNHYVKGERFLSRKSIESAPVGTYIVCGGSDGDQGDDELKNSFTGSKEFDNPNYKQSPIEQDSKSYYRFASGATMTATSDMALRPGDVVTIYCYNPSSATVTGTFTIGTENTTISLTAGQKLDFEYTITAKGATTAIVASNSEDFCVAGIEIARELPDTYKDPNLVWDTDLSGGVTQSVEAGAFTHTASSKSAGEITYSSSVPAVATVNATTGEVTPVAAGTTVITATIEQAGCYNTGTASYNVTLTDLPKPEITFVTVPTEMPQGLANQTIVVTTTGGDNFNLAITEGTGATLTINESTRTSTRIEATLSMGAEATNIELTASTERTATLAQNAVTVNVAVSACIPEGADIFTFELTGSAAATGQMAGGVIGGTVDQTALGTVSTDDNPATVDAIKIKMKDNKYVYDNNGKVEVKDNEGGSECQWAMIPTGETYKPSWSGNTYTLYYLKNVSTNKYMKRGAGRYGSNGDWYYYTTVTDATLGNGDEYKWFKATDNGIGIINRADIGSSIDQSYHLHIANQYNSTTDEYAQKPAVPCGITKNNFNDYSKVTLTTSSVANPDMIKSVEHNDKTYYIISSEGSITLHGDFKAGDKVYVDTYNRKDGTDDIEEYEIQSDADSYIYTTEDEYVCVNNIKVWRAQVGEMVDPTLTFAQSEVTLDVQQSQTTYTQVATPSVTTVSNITYQSSNTEVATVDANGQVTLVDPENIKHRTSITVTATMPAVGCYNEATASYTILVMNLTPTALQTLVDDTEEGGTLTLQDDFDNCNVTISKAIKIDAQGHKIGNLTITTAGDLTLASAMTVEDFCIASDQSEQHSGQMKNPANLTLRGNAYIDITFAPVEVNTGWYAFTVPFTVSATAGVYNGNTKMKNEYDYAIMEYQGDVRAQGKYGWIKTHKVGGKLQAGHFYVITLGDTEYKTMRFMMTKGSNLAAATSMEIHEYASAEDGDAGWNGVGNPNLYHATAAIDGITKMQTYNHTNDAFEVGTLNDSHVVGTPYFVQTNGDKTMTTYVVAEKANAPARMLATATAEEEFIVDLESDGKKQDRIFLSASDEASATYEIGHDLTKMTLGNAKVAQIAINGYNMELCDAEFVLDNNEAVFPLTITTPQAGEYTLSIKRACEGQTITLLQNGLPIVMTDGQVSIDLAKGTTTEYSLVIGRTKTDVVTGNEQLKANGEGVQKIILHNALRIIKNGKMYNVLGL